uniref:Small ribosomal subunit protein uS4c n=1 Tax=Staurocarteria cerasiformis TaxID=69401 RepID=A0A0S2LQC6_STACE|nr:ribosomal protein S4 [Carteria cerasiformis]ALO63462.1 ribosomal protein S4 [Carteria cerasiformis]
MSRYLGPKLRIIRRLGKLRGLTRKKPFRRVFRGRGPLKGKILPPGQHGLKKLFKASTSSKDYLIRLKVKQRLRFNYGLTERQLIKYIRKAKKLKETTGQVLLQLLEMRLDNIVFRLHYAPTIGSARQLITHGHIKVNNAKVTIPSYQCKAKDVISIAMKETSLKIVNRNLQDYYKRISLYKNRLEKTLAFILIKNNVAQNIPAALLLIKNRKVKVNRRVITKPNFVCKSKDVILVS